MKIIDAINQIDSLKRNTYTQDEKVRWLSRVEALIYREIVQKHVTTRPLPAFSGFDEDTPLDTELIAEAPYDDLYVKWLEAQIDYANGEIDRYNNAANAFGEVFGKFKNNYNSTWMPVSHGQYKF